MKTHDPYGGNILIEPLGVIPSPEDALTALTFLPHIPPAASMAEIPRHVRLHYAAAIRELHIPGLESARIACSIDLMLRQGYHYRDVRLARTWQMVMGEMTSAGAESYRLQHVAPAMAVLVEGHSGVGKTQLILRWLQRYPQTVWHATFPKYANGLMQLVWLSVQVPESGNAPDCSRRFMQATDEAMEGSRFAEVLARKRSPSGTAGLDEWLQFARAHFLGVLHLDEVQNLFKLPTLEQRRRLKDNTDSRELSLQDDKMLKWILSLTNSGISLVITGTPDGVSALLKRLSTAQRACTGGYHHLPRFEDPQAKGFRNVFLGQLGRYQYVRKALPLDEDLANLILTQTAGISRLIIALWHAAHRVALERRDSDELRLADFKRASATYLAPVHKAVAALNSRDPQRMSAYEDLLPTGDWFKEGLTG